MQDRRPDDRGRPHRERKFRGGHFRDRDRFRRDRRGRRFEGGGRRDRPSEARERLWDRNRPFHTLVSIDPHERLRLEVPETHEGRVLDLVAPIGKGQRALLVAAPKTGKTILLQRIAQAVAKNHPEALVIVCLVDERPEEVTDWRRSVGPSVEVFASSSDNDPEEHLENAAAAMERAMREVEAGRDVVLLLDSITRLARTCNALAGASGRTLTGGLDHRAMDFPRRFFGAARKIEKGGSLTIVGTALVETGSMMDEVIFQEFKGTGNMELVLDRKLAERRIWPAIEIHKSGTRKEEKLYPPDDYRKIVMLRRALAPLSWIDAITMLLDKLAEFPTNRAFLSSIPDRR